MKKPLKVSETSKIIADEVRRLLAKKEAEKKTKKTKTKTKK